MIDASEREIVEPHDVEIEQALLGAMLIENDSHRVAGDHLTPDDFYEPLHREIFEVAGHLIEAGHRVDARSLAPFFVDYALVSPQLTVAQYLGRLAANAVTLSGVKDYAITVRGLADRRRMLAHARATTDAALDTSVSHNDAMAAVEQSAFELGDRRDARQPVQHIAVGIDAAMRHAADVHKRGAGVVGVATGFVDLDTKLGGLAPGNLVILAGRPGMGKTALATNIATHVAEHGTGVLFFSLEMTSEEIGLRIVAERCDLSSARLRTGSATQTEIETVLRRAGEIARGIKLYTDCTGGASVAHIANRARRHMLRHDIGLIIVDYVQLMRPARGTGNRVTDVTEITNGLKALAKDLNVPIIALSQLSRAVEQRADKRPQLSDLRDSGSIEQDADVVLFVFREDYYLERAKPDPSDPGAVMDWEDKMRRAKGQAEVIIAKQRHGSTGIVQMHFDGERTRFASLSRQAPHPSMER